MSAAHSPYGDGKASEIILDALISKYRYNDWHQEIN
jgi:UDP-N-acetylglucosamine 2-epimerase